MCRGQLKCDGTRAETRFHLSAKGTSPFKSAGVSVQSTNDSRDVRISGSNAAYTIFRGSVKSTDYPLHSPVSPSLPLPCVTLWRHISTGVHISLLFVNILFPRPGNLWSVVMVRGVNIVQKTIKLRTSARNSDLALAVRSSVCLKLRVSFISWSRNLSMVVYLRNSVSKVRGLTFSELNKLGS